VIYSIDQNSNSLWDALPKLQALVSKGIKVHHFVEDVDVAFTAIGSAGKQQPLKLTRERFHHSGGADWGAALFYSRFLGKLPLDLRELEPYLGMKTSVLARRLGRNIDDLYDEFSPGDNWQLIGPSYVGDARHHRTIADLKVSQTSNFLEELMQLAQSDLLERLPQEAPRRRIDEWFNNEKNLLAGLISKCRDSGLADLYRSWLKKYLGEQAQLDLSSSLLAVEEDSAGTGLLELFISRYEQAGEIYNRVIAELGAGLRPLRMSDGELPFFAVFEHHGQVVRSGLYLAGPNIQVGEKTIPIGPKGRVSPDKLRQAGIRCLAGKAILLVTQARMNPKGRPLAMVHRGSIYMPAAHMLVRLLKERGWLDQTVNPIVRVRFGFLDLIRSIDDLIIRLPAHLAHAFGCEEIPASRLGAEYADLAREASDRLESFKTPQGRHNWQKSQFPKLCSRIKELDSARRSQAGNNPKDHSIRMLWKDAKELETHLLEETLRQVVCDFQVKNIDYWDSRGALLPWSIALGGQELYHRLIANAQISEESSEQPDE